MSIQTINQNLQAAISAQQGQASAPGSTEAGNVENMAFLLQFAVANTPGILQGAQGFLPDASGIITGLQIKGEPQQTPKLGEVMASMQETGIADILTRSLEISEVPSGPKVVKDVTHEEGHAPLKT